MVGQINVETVEAKLPVFTIDISEHQDVVNLAKEAILEQHQINPISIESNVKAHYVTGWMSHKENSKYQPLIDLVINAVKFISKGFFNQEIDFYCFNCWGIIYNPGDYTIRHSHYPSDFAVAVYLEIEDGAAPIIFNEKLTIYPKSNTMVIFPASLHHEVPKTNARRMVVSMNIDKTYA
jgi:hypothetical protein